MRRPYGAESNEVSVELRRWHDYTSNLGFNCGIQSALSFCELVKHYTCSANNASFVAEAFRVPYNDVSMASQNELKYRLPLYDGDKP